MINSVFMGSGKFALPILQAIAKKQKMNNLQVITPLNKAFSKKYSNAVEDYAKQNDIKLTLFDHKSTKAELKEEWKRVKNELPSENNFGMVCNFGYMVPGSFIDLF